MRKFAYPVFALYFAVGSCMSADGNDLEIEVKPDRKSYPLRTSANITITKCNPTNEQITVTQSCPCCDFDFEIMDTEQNPVAQVQAVCIQIVVEETWQPGQCTDEVIVWPQTVGDFEINGSSTGNPAGTGTYTAQYHWHPAGVDTEASSASFTVFSAAIPTVSTAGIIFLCLLLVVVSIRRLKQQPPR